MRPITMLCPHLCPCLCPFRVDQSYSALSEHFARCISLSYVSLDCCINPKVGRMLEIPCKM